MLKPRTTPLLLIAAILSLLASILARHLVAQAPREVVVEAAPAQPKVTVIVASQDIEYLATIGAESVREHVMIEADLPGPALQYASKLDDVVGTVAMNVIRSGSLIQHSELRSREAGLPLALEVREKYRAMTVRVDDVKGVGGFLARGNLVDLIEAHRVEGQELPSSAVLAQNLRVLAVDQDMTAVKDKPLIVKSVTLEVLPEVAESIARAQLEGTLQLLLRHPQDTQVTTLSAKKIEPQAARGNINFLQGRDTARLRTFDCDPLKPCPQNSGD
jgi:pilus assembly protein CpaB